MGWRLTVDLEEGCAEVLRALRLKPFDIFAEPYLGYIVFLMSGADKELIRLFAKQIVPLDSATGSALAFVIVSSEMRLPLKSVGNSSRAGSQKQELPIDLQELDAKSQRAHCSRFTAVERLVRSGKLGNVFAGDELVAMNYAADEFARNLGVSGKMPCVVLFDGFSDAEFDTIPLDTTVVNGLVDITRRYLDVAFPDGSYAEFKLAQQYLSEKSRERDRLAGQIASINELLKPTLADIENLESNFTGMSGQVRQALLEGARKTKMTGLVRSCSNSLLGDEAKTNLLASPTWRSFIKDYLEGILAQHEDTALLHKTIRALSASLEDNVDEDSIEARLRPAQKYIRKACATLAIEQPIATREAAENALRLLRDLQNEAISHILQTEESLSTIRALKTDVENDVERWRQNRSRHLEDDIASIEADIDAKLEECPQFAKHSFRQFFRSEARKLGWKAQAETVSKSLWKGYFKHWLKPESIAKAVRTWATMT